MTSITFSSWWSFVTTCVTQSIYFHVFLIDVYIFVIQSPQIAAEVGGALSQCNRVVMVSHGDGKIGAAKLTGEVIEIMNKINESAQGLTGRSAALVSIHYFMIHPLFFNQVISCLFAFWNLMITAFNTLWSTASILIHLEGQVNPYKILRTSSIFGNLYNFLFQTCSFPIIFSYLYCQLPIVQFTNLSMPWVVFIPYTKRLTVLPEFMQ